MKAFQTRVKTCSSRCGRQSARRLVVSNLFTGIVQGTAVVDKVEAKDSFSTIQVAFPGTATKNIKIGASVAINGTCLTVTKIDDGRLCFDIIVETLRATNLGGLENGSLVNFERSASLGDEIGGHTVSGHVHTTAEIVAIDSPSQDNKRVQFKISEPKWMKYILPKGFIAVDGCSLTVGEVSDDGFSVYLIPETLRATVLGLKEQGDSVNIEIEAQTQAIVDTVERVVARYMDTSRK